MDKKSLLFLVLFIMAAIASAVFLAINVSHTLTYHDNDSLFITILWALATAGCIAGVIWLLKGSKKST
ncbi:MAG: hypothetical protein A2Z02_04610 [Chloroflexi bacterium RBG_16_48_7]|nr:MAG: hypothetical protein A2Z02_04610 [Chloroflexi bacterium RBG_16_48_7]